MVDYEDIETAVDASGMCLRGGFFDAEKQQTIVLVGNVGPRMWAAFAKEKAHWVEPNPLDHWTKKTLLARADLLKLDMVFPFEGPNFAPFQSWALRAGGVYTSPIGPLIDPRFGLWHAYRGAFIIKGQLKGLRERLEGKSPCESCQERPCLQACPVQAFKENNIYDVEACGQHLKSVEGAGCLGSGCLARRACPIGVAFEYGAEHASFHMERFLAQIKLLGLDSE